MTKPFLKRHWTREHIITESNYEPLNKEQTKVTPRKLTRVDEFQLLVYGKIFLPALILIADYLQDGQINGFGLIGDWTI